MQLPKYHAIKEAGRECPKARGDQIKSFVKLLLSKLLQFCDIYCTAFFGTVTRSLRSVTRMAFIIPMYALLGMNVMMSLSLLLPLPISRPSVFLIKFSKTPVGQAATATICGFLFLMATVPIYEIYTLHQHKEAQIKSITSKNRR